MALSDQLTRLAARAKEAEDNAAAAQDKAKADLEADVEVARGSAEAQHQALSESVAASKGKISEWWNDLEEMEQGRRRDPREDRPQERGDGSRQGREECRER